MTDAELAELLTLTMEVDTEGTTIYRNHLGKMHRVHGPAMIRASGTKVWYLNNQWHRDDGPAIEYADGTRSWYLDDQKLTEEQWNERLQSL